MTNKLCNAVQPPV